MHKILIALAFVCLAVRAETVATVDVDGIAVPLRATSVLAEDVLDADQAVARARLDYAPGKESVAYFDANNRKIARPVESGYFRRTLTKPPTAASWYRNSGRTPPRSEVHRMR